MIIWDTETTGFLKPDVAELGAQPYIVELAMIKVDAEYEIIECYEALLLPGVPLDEEVHKKITGLKNADLADKPTFLELYEEVAGFVLGEDTWVAHNLGFDLGVLVCDLKRIGKEFAFPYPPNGICTVDRTFHMKGHRLKMTDLYELLMKKKLAQSHRAMADALALLEIVRKLKLA